MLAIYNRKGSFSDRWIELCRERAIPFIEVDLFDTRLVSQLRNEKVIAFLCHPPMLSRASMLAGRSISLALSRAGIRVFPTAADYWHFDDKIAQKYLFEAVGIPTPSTVVLFERKSALKWMSEAVLPTVFKLRSGAGSTNVSLVRQRVNGVSRVERMFGRGVVSTDGAFGDYKTKVRMHAARRDWLATLQRAPQTLRSWWNLRNELDRERGYVYFQEFIDGNSDDTRVTVIGDRAFAFRRMVRPGDFRASGSGMIDYEPSKIDQRCIALAFDAAHRIGSTCMAFDLVKRPHDGAPLVVEASFAFASEAVHKCPGHWGRDGSWKPGSMRPEDAVFNDLMKDLEHASQ